VAKTRKCGEGVCHGAGAGRNFSHLYETQAHKRKNQKQKKMAWVARPTLHEAKRSALQKVQIRFKKSLMFTK
jgi:hypothetical protein